ncbi:MAG: hypothetical protein ACRYGP_03430 [Janthinobacterium lividum]
MPEDVRRSAVELATPDDLRTILEWLKAEHRRDHGIGFWVNRRIISEARENGDLWVIRQDG